MVPIVGCEEDINFFRDHQVFENLDVQFSQRYVDGYYLSCKPSICHPGMPRSAVQSDFSQSSRKTPKGGRELLFRALGDKKKLPVVWDISLGLGRDAHMIYDYGYDMVLFERHPMLFCLNLMALVKKSLNIPLFQDFESCSLAAPNVIYFDPMYPKSKSSAATSIELDWLREIVGTDNDSQEIARRGLEIAKDRMVIKRPKWASPLIEKPKHQFLGKSVRYDMYLTRPQKNRPIDENG